jgi:hypothetical protein
MFWHVAFERLSPVHEDALLRRAWDVTGLGGVLKSAHLRVVVLEHEGMAVRCLNLEHNGASSSTECKKLVLVPPLVTDGIWDKV